MTILTDASLEFAKEHIQKYYDSDFFPKPIEFEAIWQQWDDVKSDLMSKNVSKLWITPPRVMAIAKPKGGFRVVHQLEPLDAVVYTALACHIAPQIEDARVPVEFHVACSYRLSIANGSFFGAGSGWTNFEDKTKELAKKYSHVLATDITDFYNQIYLHRVSNAIESADAGLKALGDDIEFFLSSLNSKSSQGVPVGPAASIVMSEAVLIDVDTFLRDQGLEHTRYVDDFRLFSNSPRQLQIVLERLTLYLYQTHRLTISSEKTIAMQADEYVEKLLQNHYIEEKHELLQTLTSFNTYTGDYEEIEVESVDETQEQQAQLMSALEKILEYDHLDLGLARGVIRTARRNSIPVLAPMILDHFQFFTPVVNDVFLYLNEVTDTATAVELRPFVEKVIELPAMDGQIVRFWMEWYVAQHEELMKSQKVHHFVFSGPNVENQALAAITTKNVAWVRTQKTNVYNLGGWGRRAVLNASRVLPSDERNHWLKLFTANGPALEKWVAKWVLETA